MSFLLLLFNQTQQLKAFNTTESSFLFTFLLKCTSPPPPPVLLIPWRMKVISIYPNILLWLYWNSVIMLALEERGLVD